jgi:hypothetical protein
MDSSATLGVVRSASIALLSAAAVAACAQPGPPSSSGPPPRSSAPGTCDAAGAQFASGQEATPALLQEARRRSGSVRVRVIKPGQFVTQEFDEARLTLEVDASNRITRVRCG